MGSFNCKCGHVTKDEDPDYGASGIFFTFGECEDLVQRVVKGIQPTQSAEEIEDLIDGEINEKFTSVFRCPTCSRVYFSQGNGTWACFAPDGRIGAEERRLK